jgi:hypothetical protein
VITTISEFNPFTKPTINGTFARKFKAAAPKCGRNQSEFSHRTKSMSAHIIEQLRDTLPYLKDQGWANTAALINEAANELERLTLKTQDLEERLNHSNQGNIESRMRTHFVSRLFG